MYPSDEEAGRRWRQGTVARTDRGRKRYHRAPVRKLLAGGRVRRGYEWQLHRPDVVVRISL